MLLVRVQYAHANGMLKFLPTIHPHLLYHVFPLSIYESPLACSCSTSPCTMMCDRRVLRRTTTSCPLSGFLVTKSNRSAAPLFSHYHFRSSETSNILRYIFTCFGGGRLAICQRNPHLVRVLVAQCKKNITEAAPVAKSPASTWSYPDYIE